MHILRILSLPVIGFFGWAFLYALSPTSVPPPYILYTKSDRTICNEWLIATPPCGIPIRNTDNIVTLPDECRRPNVRDLSLARSVWAGIQGIHGMTDAQSIEWLMKLQKQFITDKTDPKMALDLAFIGAIALPPKACERVAKITHS